MAGASGTDPELQSFLQMEQQKAQFQSQIHLLTDTCWEKCVDKPRDKLDGRTETCMQNCVGRFIDTTMIITQRFQSLLQKQAGH